MKYLRSFLVFLSTILLYIPGITGKNQSTHYLFAHGLGATERQASYYRDKHVILTPYHTFSFPDAENGILDYSKTSLAQDNEIECLKKAYDDICIKTKLRKPNIVLSGMSRGASTIINFMGKHNPKKIKALVLESPFDSMESVLQQKLKTYWLSWLPFGLGLELAQWVAKNRYGQYNPDGLQPIDHITKIKNKNLPILFIYSKEDILIPWESTYSLFKACKKAGFSAVHAIIIEHGSHGYLLEDKSHHEYTQALHAFYQKYNLPHDSMLAQKGSKLLI